MKSVHDVFEPGSIKEEESSAITESLTCLQRFSDAFDAEDLNAMDAELHFPHHLLSGEEMIIWEKPGQMPETFFDELRAGGWAKTVCELAKPILVSTNKVHYLWHYSRRSPKGETLSYHENLWIVTKEKGRWAIKLRSY